ncbi:MAG: acyl-CoA-binding protein [bacterium]|nr:acyl-CoA-binding protein [bacterium]
MSDDLSARFEQAAEEVKGLSKPPDNEMLLSLYGLFKQASKGDCEGKRPGMMDFVGRAKYDAWAARSGMTNEEAMAEYIRVVAELVAADG